MSQNRSRGLCAMRCFSLFPLILLSWLLLVDRQLSAQDSAESRPVESADATASDEPSAEDEPAATRPGEEAEEDTDAAEKPDAKPLTDAEKFDKALDELEEEIVKRERIGKYGHPEVEAYASTLEEEYLRNQQEIRNRGAVDARNADATGGKLLKRQQHLSMLLWQVQRVGAQLGKPKDNGRSMSTKIQALLSQHKSVIKNAQLMRRFHDLSRRASELSRLSYTSSLTNNFHFVRPKGNQVLSRPSENSPLENRGTGKLADANSQGASIKFEDGPFQKVRGPISNLIRFRWEDGKLIWDKEHWKTPFAGETLESIDQEVDEELKRRGVPFPEEDRLGAFRKKRLFETPQSMLLFQDFQFVASGGKMARTSFSSSGKTSSARFTAGQIEASFIVSPEKTELMLREESAPNRTLTLRVDKEGGMRLSLIGEHILLLEQAADGAARWVDIGQEVTAIKASNIAALYSEYPERVESELFARMEHSGIELPLTRYDETVVRRALDRLAGVDEQTKAEFEQLMQSIDGGSFSQRQKAYRELQNNLSRFSMLISEVSDADVGSTEVLSRLSKLTESYNEKYREIDGLIAATGWLNDSDYLLGLAMRVEEAKASPVISRLSELTGEDFGADLVKWREWASGQK